MAQAISRLRRGWMIVIYALTDIVGRPFALMLTLGNVADVPATPKLLARMGRVRCRLADKGYERRCAARFVRPTLCP